MFIIMRFGLDVPNIGKHLSNVHNHILLAKEAEKAGWDGYFLWNTFLNDKIHFIANPLVCMSAIACQTTNIKLGFMVTPLAFFKPWIIASEIVTLDHLSNGRFILGVGSGFNPKDFSSFNDQDDLKIRAEKLDESLEIITGLWTGKKFSYSGKHYKINNVQILPTCKQTPRVPIWVAGYWPHKKPFRRASRFDGVYAGSDDFQISVEQVNEIMKYVNSHKEHSGSIDCAIWIDYPEKDNLFREKFKEYEKSGLTWMNIPIQVTSEFEEILELIKAGPPNK